MNAAKGSLAHRSLSEKLLFSSFLLMMTAAYLMALTFLYFTHAGLDGKSGIDVQDITMSYHGDPGDSKMQAMLRGPMKIHSTPLDTTLLVDWLHAGASKVGYQAIAGNILHKDCEGCHSGSTAQALHIPSYSTYAGTRAVTKTDKGMSVQTMVELGHIHLFGVGLVLFGVGYIFALTDLKMWIKASVIVIPFLGMFIDVVCWFLTKLDPVFGWVVVISGGAMGVAMTAEILISLYQMWLAKPATLTQ